MINKNQTLIKLLEEQKRIVFESDEDEGAAEYWAEIQSVIDSIVLDKPEDEIQKSAAWVGLTECLVITELQSMVK